MKTKTIITSILGLALMIGLISLVSATTIYAGNNYSFQSEEYAYWDVVGNSSNMKGMNVTWEDGNITLRFDIRYKPDNFTLIFFNNETEVIKEVEVPVHHYSGGGGTSYIYRDRNVTEFIFLGEDCEEDLCEIDINDTSEIILEDEPEDLGFWRRFWNWMKGLFGK